MDQNAPAVEAADLSRSFGSTRAVEGLDLRVPRGGVYAMLGPNGAGKTTTIRILATLLRPDAGTARVLGFDVATEPDEVRRRISLTGQFATIDEELTGRENLTLLARLRGFRGTAAKQRAADLLSTFELSVAAGRPVKTYSGGMRRRLDIAAGLIATPELLFLDEPTTGLDPAARLQVWELVESLAARGTTILLTTQYLDEADRLADRIAVLDQGRVIAEGTSAELKARVASGVLTVHLADPSQGNAGVAVLTRLGAERAESAADTITVHGLAPRQAAQAVAELGHHDIAVVAFALDRPTLDEVFLTLTGRARPATA